MFKKNLRHSCQTPTNLDLYSPMEKRQLKMVDAKFQVEVGYWASEMTCKTQNLWDNNQDIYTKVFEQPTTTY